MTLWHVTIEHKREPHERKTRAWFYAVIAESEAQAHALAIERNTNGLAEYKAKVARVLVQNDGDAAGQVVDLGMRFR